MKQDKRTCNDCKKQLNLEEFYTYNRKYKKKNGEVSVYPIKSVYCKSCDGVRNRNKTITKEQKEQYKQNRINKLTPELKQIELEKRRKYLSLLENKIKVILRNSKRRAIKNNYDFNLEYGDIKIPENCPILGIPLVFGTKENYEFTPSLDRVDKSKGYIKDNIGIISKKANSMKSSASKEEMFKFIVNIIDYMGLSKEDIVRAIENKESIESEDKEPQR
jgi:hypothetical protein